MIMRSRHLVLVGGVLALAVLVALSFRRARPAARSGAQERERAEARVDATAAPKPRAVAAAPRAPEAAPMPSGKAPTEYRNEAELMGELRRLGETNPARTLALARAGEARFSGSADGAERSWMLVKSLVNLTRFSEARAAARVMVDKYSATTWADDVDRHLLHGPPDPEGAAATPSGPE